MSYRKQLTWYLLAGTKGGKTRAKILSALHNRPYNANQLAIFLDLDYSTIRHHLNVLLKNTLIVRIGDQRYGAVYFLSEFLISNFDSFNEVWDGIREETDE